MKNIIKYLKQGGLLFILLCIALALNNRFGYITLIGIFSIVTFWSVTIRHKMGNGDFVVLCYLICYILISFINGISYPLSSLVLYGIAPLFFYQYGKHITRSYKGENELITAWLIIIFCYCIDIFVIRISNIIEAGSLLSGSRDFYFTDNETSAKSATLIGLPMGIGMIGLPMFFIVKKMGLKISFLSLFILSIVTTFSLLNRTGIIVAGLCFLAVIGYKYRKNGKLLFLSFLSVFSIVFILIYTGVISSDLLSAYDERNVDLATAGNRTTRWSDAFINLFTHPFGWTDGTTYFVHNMWLDVARISGTIPFILLVYMTYDCFLKAFKLIKRYNNSLSYMMLGLNVCFFATCFVEPITGSTHFMLYCMLWGTESALLKNEHNYIMSNRLKTKRFNW